jgi:hypothetical protein
MKRFFVTLLLTGSFFSAAAQDNAASIDLLKAPSSPAANLLGTSPSDVQQFTDPSDFMASLQHATNSYSTLPTNYAVDIAPDWLFFGRKITYRKFTGDGGFKNIGPNILQSLVVSAASKAGDSSKAAPSLGFGVKFSLIRGNIPASTLADADAIVEDIMKAIQDNIKQEKDKVRSTEKYRNASTDAKNQMLLDAARRGEQAETDEISNLREKVKKLDFKRYGWKWDINAGIALDYPGQRFNNAEVNKAGAWTNLGYEDSATGLSFIALVRYLYQPDKVIANSQNVLQQNNVSTLDAGARIIFTPQENKFTLSAEGIYRSVLTPSGIDPAWRFTVNAEYEVAANKRLTLALGRDYEGTFHKDGNVIAALNLIMGFGNNRPVRGN